MLISHRRRPRRLVPLLIATAMIMAMNSPGLSALASEVAVTPDESIVVRQEEVMPVVGEDVEAAPAEPEVVPEPELTLDWLPIESEVTDSEEAEPVTVEAAVLDGSILAAVIAPAVVYPYASVGAVQLEGWTRAPHAKWTSGDVKGYVEGEWIPFRLSIDNTGGSAVTVQVPQMIYKVDHINGGAVAIDETAGWSWAIEGDPATDYVPTVQDSNTDPMYLETQLPEAAGFVLEKGEMGYIYFWGHLALTPYWMPLEGLYGASGYPGSSAQARLVSWNGENIGDRTVPFPVGKETAPTGALTGLKFEDLNGNGTQEAGEDPLSGWVFHLEYLDPVYGFSLTETSTADGTFEFTGLPPGEYMLTEDSQPGWTLTTDLSSAITVATGATTGPIKVGNAPAMVDKTWRLNLSAAVPAADSFFVRYVIDGQIVDRALTPGVDSTMQVTWGTTITSWQFFALMGAEEIPLSGILGPAERLVEAQTNSFTYIPGEISGHKWIAGDPPTGGAGWTIDLYRNGVLYDTDTTGADGSFSFTGLLPGSYTIEEVEQDDYMKIVPAGDYLGPFIVISGSVFVEGTDFTNAPRPTGILVTKTADPTLVHVGDEITYTIDVLNTGQVDVTLTSVTDPMFEGGANLLTSPVLLLPGQSLSDLGLEIVKVMAAPDADMVDNISYATGTTVFGPVSDDDDAHVDILRPAIDVTKSVVPESVLDSGEVHYYVTVTNSGTCTLTVDVVDYVDAAVHLVLDTGLVLGPGEHKDYDWPETVTQPTEDTVVATGVDELGGEKGTVTDEASAAVAVDVTKTFMLTLFEGMPMADSFFVRYVIDGQSHDLSLLPGADEYSADIIVPFGTVITSWQFFALMGAEEVPLSEVMGPETLQGPMTNPLHFTPGRISGMKYDDMNGDGELDAGEPGLPGWTINLYRNGVLYDSMVTGADGAYSFTGLLPGLYTLDEVQQPGWEMTDSPGEYEIGDEVYVTGADFGNHHLDVTKTFSLTYADVPDGVELFVLYQLAQGDPVRVDLTGSNPYTGSVEIPWGSTIIGVWWMATYHGHDYLLGMQEMEETLEENMLNEFTYSASASGYKFNDLDRSATWEKPDEPGLAGWTIGLYRMAPRGDINPAALPSPELGFELFATTVTDADGSYSFTGLLPGTYYVAEELQDGWDQMVAPVGTFLIINGADVTDLDFGNAEAFLPFTDTELEKVADKTEADPGELVTYTLTYRNIGDGIIDVVTIVDDYDERYMVPVDIAGATQGVGTLTWVDNVPLGPGDERSITYTMRVIEDMPVNAKTNVDNVAVITPGGHKADWRVVVDNPYLPFTGATLALLGIVAAGALLIGVVLRRRTHGV